MTTASSGEPRPGLDIAIIGMAGRFPGARDVAAFWRNLCAGVESVSILTEEELLGAGVDPALIARPEYVRARAVLDDIDMFDAELFGFTPREAAALDPQHRLFLECAWEAFENAGIDPERAGGPVGVYAGSSLSGYLAHLFPDGPRLQSAADVAALLALDKDFLATRVSYKLNLEGPSIAVQTACSTSLVAVHLACQALLTGECDMALAGGVSVSVPQKSGYLYQEGAIASPDGHCRAFDAGARGTVGGSGVGVVLLKRLDDAIADRDAIVAVIKGSAVNNDGRVKIGYTAPRVEGQARVIRAAHAAAGVDADSITYVEAHGTGTPLGDPIEIAALTQAFRASTDRKGFCAIGSAKTNVGHLDAAAGVTGLIKAALAVAHGRIPPSLHFRAPNPALDLENSPFHVAAELTAWSPAGAPRRAGVSSFGLGGTNAHVVLEEAPPPPDVDPPRPCELLVLSARSSASLGRLTDALAEHLEARADLELGDVARTLQLGRRAFGHRRAVVCRSREEAARALRDRGGAARTGGPVAGPRPVAFLFPGQGAQRPGMGRDLYESEPVFRAEVDGCAQRLERHLGTDIRALLFPAPADAEEAAKRLDRTSMTQPALFVVEYALARLWMAWGVTPDAMLGHSVGEYVAACLAGCLSLDDALSLVAARGRLMEATPDGAMLAVSASEAEIAGWLGEEVALAAVNGPRRCVLSGSAAAIERIEQELAGRGIEARRLRTARAFHSRLMDGAVAGFREAVGRVALRAPRIPWVSNVTGTWITAAEAQDPDYWVRHLRGTVRFAEGVKALREQGERILLEVGPGQTLTALSRQGAAGSVAVASMPAGGETAASGAAGAALLDAVGQVWVAGAAVDWAGLQAGKHRRRVALPATPFERKRCWLERPGARGATSTSVGATSTSVGATSTSVGATSTSVGSSTSTSVGSSDLDGIFYVPSWKRAPLEPPALAAGADEAHWLVLADDEAIGLRLVERLERAGRRVTRVRSGERFERLAERAFTLRPDQPEDHAALLRELDPTAGRPTRIVHAFSLGDPRARHDAAPETQLGQDAFRAAQRRGSASLLWLARALSQQPGDTHLVALASGLHDLTGRETLRPEHAPLLGICRSIPLEYPHVRCRALDLEAAEPDAAEADRLVERILAEARSDAGDTVVAYRGHHRWVPTVEPLPLRPAQGAPPLLREGGVYLITGGLGGIGLWLADYLARTVRARLILTGRSAPTDEQRARLLALEKAGAEVLALRADAADASQMRAAAREALDRFGAVHGVIHAAGVTGGGLIDRLTADALDAELGPKALGALSIEEIARSLQPDFVLLCSSITALSGGLARAGYAAANAFLDAYAQACARRAGPYTVSINLDRWRNVGMAARAEARLLALGIDDVILDGMSPEQGQQVFHRVLSQAALPQVIVSVRPLHGLPRDDEGAALARRLGAGGAAVATGSGAPAQRAEAAAERLSPEAVTAQVTAIWARAFGVDPVDPGKDFFALGGESLLALQILNRVRETFQVEVPLREFFERPTVAALAERVQQARGQAPASAEPALVALPRTSRRLPGAGSAQAPARPDGQPDGQPVPSKGSKESGR
ncbi:SDR family NAD(P)-dependent oxidoreductase [Sorangium cellulosum]|uniref:Polyketide synthase type I n=1 Tax=Sorangium cellulosum TaxID=56 RepID=A0A150QRY1_SORCE|nr:type I polyketide synthase [Sorangium cellulosum]KYF70741.1 polyketide synthase type I [Sorangium cellulosum]